ACWRVGRMTRFFALKWMTRATRPWSSATESLDYVHRKPLPSLPRIVLVEAAAETLAPIRWCLRGQAALRRGSIPLRIHCLLLVDATGSREIMRAASLQPAFTIRWLLSARLIIRRP